MGILSIFGIGGGMSIYEGILHIQHPSELKDPTINYIVLALAMVFESFSFRLWRTRHRPTPSRAAGRLTLWGPTCLLYTSPSPRDRSLSRMPSSA